MHFQAILVSKCLTAAAVRATNALPCSAAAQQHDAPGATNSRG
jgi:hypothetical protein